MAITQAYILCGGLGTRLGSLVKDTPKPMLPVGGKPILEHTVRLLKAQGFTKILLVAGYKADVVEQFFKELDWGIEIEVFREPDLVGTAGSMPLLSEKLDENFLMVYGDVYIDFDVRAFCNAHEHAHALASFLVRPSSHPWDSNLIQAGKDKMITQFVVEHKPGEHYQNLGDCAVYVVNKRVLDFIPQGKSDFMKHVFPKALESGEKLLAYELESSGFVRDMGKPERFPIVEKYLKDRDEILAARRERLPIKTVFLDRDGVINREVDLLTRPDQLELLPGVTEAIKLFNNKGMKVIVVTNQPQVARGLVTESTLELIHNKMKRLLESGGAHIDALYYCPHHPETQHGEGVEKLRKGCDCRKPASGMILQAKDEHKIDLRSSIIVGDSWTDTLAGQNAGIRTILLPGGRPKEGVKADYEFPTLLDAAKAIVLGRV